MKELGPMFRNSMNRKSNFLKNNESKEKCYEISSNLKKTMFQNLTLRCLYQPNLTAPIPAGSLGSSPNPKGPFLVGPFQQELVTLFWHIFSSEHRLDHFDLQNQFSLSCFNYSVILFKFIRPRTMMHCKMVKVKGPNFLFFIIPIVISEYFFENFI